jgi:hypothetical protein
MLKRDQIVLVPKADPGISNTGESVNRSIVYRYRQPVVVYYVGHMHQYSDWN